MFNTDSNSISIPYRYRAQGRGQGREINDRYERFGCISMRPKPPINYVYFEEKRDLDPGQNWTQIGLDSNLKQSGMRARRPRRSYLANYTWEEIKSQYANEQSAADEFRTQGTRGDHIQKRNRRFRHVNGPVSPAVSPQLRACVCANAGKWATVVTENTYHGRDLCRLSFHEREEISSL
ncbi:hypothetical protein EVAR_102872_1 [Eumeta japonica]|uniref:Uncharacterized protein n=1 Tax=Eumeta variegata TaxID=151549 RepID=A0A4C1UMF6_EUMVA|nr:hypothetical protein EVAR_102872_1 [Eumeta japonica]